MEICAYILKPVFIFLFVMCKLWLLSCCNLQRMVAISGCGHLPHEECPKALLAAVSPFISRLVLRPELQMQ